MEDAERHPYVVTGRNAHIGLDQMRPRMLSLDHVSLTTLVNMLRESAARDSSDGSTNYAQIYLSLWGNSLILHWTAVAISHVSKTTGMAG